MKTINVRFTRIFIVVLVWALSVMTVQSHQDKPNFETLVARGRAIAAADSAATELRDQQSDDSARRGFDIGMAVAETDTLPGPGKQRIHDSLPLAEQSGFEVAVKYSLARNRKKLTDLAPRGAELAQLDPLAAELRIQQFNDDARLGFDIGMAAAEKDTLHGPGKQKMQNSLYPAEQQGFAAAVSFSLDRNRNAELARIGANIARVSSAVGLARNVDRDVFRRLGFDIAAGLYGDPALGSKGSTKMGPGALAIRDALSPAAQLGFNQGANFLLPGGFGFSDSPTVRSNSPTNRSDSPTVKKDDYFGVGGATSRTQDAFQPENTLKVTVRYKKEFGYITDGNAFGYVGPTSCTAFSVSVIAGDGSEQQRSPSRISGSGSKMDEQGGYYFCNYLVSFLPLNQSLKVDVRVIGSDLTSSWTHGSQSQPPPGQQRTIIIVSGRDNGPLQLTSTRSRASQLFEMVYTSQPR